MRSSVAKLGYAVAVLVAASYALVTLRGPQGVPALIERQNQIRTLEKQNADLAREIEFRRERIQRLQEDESEQELEIRQRLKLVRPGEKVFILQDPVAQRSPRLIRNPHCAPAGPPAPRIVIGFRATTAGPLRLDRRHRYLGAGRVGRTRPLRDRAARPDR
jgi:cell division protein FtsB